MRILPSLVVLSQTVAATIAVAQPAEEGAGIVGYAEPPADKPEPGVTAVYDSGLKLTTGDELYELRMSFRNQMRFEGNRALEDGNQWEDHFYIARSRLQVEGYLDGEGNKFKVEFGFGDSGSFSFLKEMWMDRQIGEQLFVRAGQWRRPFSRQEMVSDYTGAFLERSIANELAGGGRDLGVALHNDYDQDIAGIEWAVGVFNTFSGGADRPNFSTSCEQEPASTDIMCTNTRPTTFPDDFGPTIAARVGYSTPGAEGLTESDLEGGPLRYAIAGSYKIDLVNFDAGQETSWRSNTSHGLEVDALIKAMGFSLHAMAVMMKLKSDRPDFGLLVQPGYMVVQKKLELVGRFSLATERAEDRTQLEGRAAINYFMRGNAWRLSTDGGFIQYTGDGAADDKPDLQVRVQLQLQI